MIGIFRFAKMIVTKTRKASWKRFFRWGSWSAKKTWRYCRKRPPGDAINVVVWLPPSSLPSSFPCLLPLPPSAFLSVQPSATAATPKDKAQGPMNRMTWESRMKRRRLREKESWVGPAGGASGWEEGGSQRHLADNLTGRKILSKILRLFQRMAAVVLGGFSQDYRGFFRNIFSARDVHGIL